MSFVTLYELSDFWEKHPDEVISVWRLQISTVMPELQAENTV